MLDSSPAAQARPTCPYLEPVGGAADPRGSFPGRQCRAGLQPQPLDPEYQLAFCLSDRFQACGRYVAEGGSAPEAAPEAAPEPTPGPTLASPEPTPAPAPRAAPAPEAPSPAPPGTERASRRTASVVSRLAAVLVLLLVAATVGYGLAFLSAELVGRAGTAGLATVTSAAPSLASAPAAAPSTTSTPAVSARPTSTARGSTSPAASPGATPAGSPRIHVVARGENLTTIATRYGVTVQAITAANGITDPNTIYAGQKLVIPAP